MFRCGFTASLSGREKLQVKVIKKTRRGGALWPQMITTYNAVLNDVWRETNVCEISGSEERTAGGHSEREARGGYPALKSR